LVHLVMSMEHISVRPAIVRRTSVFVVVVM